MIVLCVLVDLLALVALARVLLTFLPPPSSGWPASAARGLLVATDPVLAPVRSLLPPVRVGPSAVDLSALVVFLGLVVVSAAVC